MQAELSNKNRFVKRNKNDIVLWLDGPGVKGDMVFSFDGVKRYNLFEDYPQALTLEEKAIFDRENPFWAEFFSDRK